MVDVFYDEDGSFFRDGVIVDERKSSSLPSVSAEFTCTLTLSFSPSRVILPVGVYNQKTRQLPPLHTV
jgi:hypothetical protein